MKTLKEFIVESKNASSKLPETMVDGDKITIKVKGKNYLIKHFAEKDGSYGKFHIFLDDKPIKLYHGSHIQNLKYIEARKKGVEKKV